MSSMTQHPAVAEADGPVITRSYTEALTRASHAQLAADVALVIECAAVWMLNDGDITAEQHLELQRIFPRRPGYRSHDQYQILIQPSLRAVADDLEPHWQFEQGVLDRDGERVRESHAVMALLSAEAFARRLIVENRKYATAVAS